MPPRRAHEEDDVDEDEELDQDIVDDSDSEDFDGTDYDPPEVLGDLHWHRRCIGDLIG
jgi:hypothetical protein